jgi:CHAT domain-containing protein/Tfp pilus assembly protein PilF
MLVGDQRAEGGSGNVLRVRLGDRGVWQSFTGIVNRRSRFYSEHDNRGPRLQERLEVSPGYQQRQDKAVAAAFLFVLISCGLGCGRPSPQEVFEHARLTFQQGNLAQSEREAAEGYRRFKKSPDWAWKFRILQAQSLLWRSNYPEVLALLDSQGTNPPEDYTVSILTIKGIAHSRQGHFEEATQAFKRAEQLCAVPAPACGDAFQGIGLFAFRQNLFPEARQYLERSLSSARSTGDRFLEATSLLNLGAVFLKEERLDEAIDHFHDADKDSTEFGAGDIAMAARGNTGWAYYLLGDSEKALGLLLETEKGAEERGDDFVLEDSLTNLGYVYMDRGDFDLAQRSFRRALELAKVGNNQEHIVNALRVLARLALRTGDLDKANQYAEEVLAIARNNGNHLGEVYPMLVQGQVAVRRGNPAAAMRIFQAIERDPACPPSLKWLAQHSLALLFEDGMLKNSADKEYLAALTTLEAAREGVKHVDARLSFLANAASIYDDYLHFLISHGRSDEALRWADYNRARTLAEGLDELKDCSEKAAFRGPRPLNAPGVARHAKGAILSYWLGEKQSYLWAITPRKTAVFTLPAKSEIEAAAQRYRDAVKGEVLRPVSPDGLWLYQTLVAPALPLLKKDEKVFVIPDGSLNNVNFETFVVPAYDASAKPHFWIEDATITAASSLRVLATSNADRRSNNRKLLLIGNSVSPGKEYPELPHAASQMEGVARHFTDEQRQVFARAQATPAAYLASHPEQYSQIHFVAHGTASRLSPLDSAIVLSTAGGEDDFKLYAREIIRHPLKADLVTISACYGAGDRFFAGEGLVGLSWAFILAGAHNVVAALWEAYDVPTEQLMNHFYDELDKDVPPDVALRAAKLSLLRGGRFQDPVYWAPFQLYAGGAPPKKRCGSDRPDPHQTAHTLSPDTH